MTEEWAEHPKLKGRVDPARPDCLLVIVHEGGPRTSRHPPEVVWTRITGCVGEAFDGVLLNKPAKLESLDQGTAIRFVIPTSGEYPIRVTMRYLDERPRWRMLASCNRCGLSELFDPPSDLLNAVFPESGQAPSTFTAFCWCGGMQVVRLRQYGANKWK